MSDEKPTTESQILASHYAACFSTKSGEIVLADLEKLFASDDTPDFVQRPGMAYDLTEAAIRNGRRQVVSLIRSRRKAGTQKTEQPKQRKARR